MSEQYIPIHNMKVQLDTPGQIDLQVTLVSEFDWFEYKENICIKSARCSGVIFAAVFTCSSGCSSTSRWACASSSRFAFRLDVLRETS